MKSRNKQVPESWEETVELTDRYLRTKNRADVLWERKAGEISPEERPRCQHLFYGVVRNLVLFECLIKQNVRRMPRGRLCALLFVALAELLDSVRNGTQREPVVVHHAVEKAKALLSSSEARLVNALLRRVPEALGAWLAEASPDPEKLAIRYSHPEWLVMRWLRAFGEDRLRELLEWNQTPAEVYLRLFGEPPEGAASFLERTPWEGFHRVAGGGAPGWAAVEGLLRSGSAYIQDPATRIPVELAAPQAGERILDLCAAPGGKSLLLAAARGMGSSEGRLVCLDRPGARLRRLEANMRRYPWAEAAVVGADLLETGPAELEALGLPGAYDAVLLDAPCSNTGVFRRRVDARWLVEPDTPSRLARTQGRLLKKAAGFVHPGGRLVYSTCSIEREENRDVVDAFVAASGDRFRLERVCESYPWETGHDGGGAYLLRREP